MNQRFDFSTALEAYKATLALSIHCETTSLEKPLRTMVKVRASQLNGCAFCIDMHWKEARALGETEARLYGLDAWAENALYTPRERAALAWAEAVTNLRDGHVSDAVYKQALASFNEREVAELTYLVVAINGWNRLCIAMRIQPGAPLPKV